MRAGTGEQDQQCRAGALGGVDVDRRPGRFADFRGRGPPRCIPAGFAHELLHALERSGFARADEDATASVVLNVVDPEDPRSFRRRSKGTFVAALWARPEVPGDELRETYPMLVRALANISLCYVPGHGVLFTTTERGHYVVPEGEGLAEAVVRRLVPLATARLVIDDEFRTDLEPEPWRGDELTRELALAGRRLDGLGLLPTPFPVEELVDEHDLRHIKRLYAIGGLSYGKPLRPEGRAPVLDERERRRQGASRAAGPRHPACLGLRRRGRADDPERAARRRAATCLRRRDRALDDLAAESAGRRDPPRPRLVGGIAATEVNYPCGTAELAESVAALITAAPDPARAVVGLRNHGITASGESLTAIIDRIEPRLLRQVPMT